MKANEFEFQLGELENQLDRLKALYEMYFQGIERIEPQIARKAVDRKVRMLRKEIPRNTALRFRFQTMVQRYTTYQTYWNRIARKIEEGTFERDVKKAKARVRNKRKEKVEEKKQESFELDLDADIDLDNLFNDAAVVAPPPPPAPSNAGRKARQMPSRTDLQRPAPIAPPGAAPPGAARPRVSQDQARATFGKPAARLTPNPRDTNVAGAVRATPPPAPISRPPVPPPAPAARVKRAGDLRRRAVAPPSKPKRGDDAQAHNRPTARPGGANDARRPPPTKRPGAAAVVPNVPPPRKPQKRGDDASLRKLYNEYTAARRNNNESGTVRYEKMAKMVNQQRERLKKKYGGKDVEFKVVVRDGRVGLKPKKKG